MILLFTSIGFTAFAQDSKGVKEHSQKEETIIIKKSNSDPQTIIEIKNGNVYVNDEKVATINDHNAGKFEKKIIIDNNNDHPQPFSDYDMKENAPRKAMLGVLTDPNTSQNGAVIKRVSPNSPAEKAGLEAGDVITQIDGTNIGGAKDLVNNIGDHSAGDKVSITYERNNKSEQTEAMLESPNEADIAKLREFNPNMPNGMDMWNPMMHPFIYKFKSDNNFFAAGPKLGITAEDLADGNGIEVLDIKPNSPAESAGLQKNDVITEFDNEKISSIDDLQMTLHDINPAKKVKLKYQRDGKSATTNISFPKPVRKEDL